jgi:hypothetical protein
MWNKRARADTPGSDPGLPHRGHCSGDPRQAGIHGGEHQRQRPPVFLKIHRGHEVGCAAPFQCPGDVGQLRRDPPSGVNCEFVVEKAVTDVVVLKLRVIVEAWRSGIGQHHEQVRPPQPAVAHWQDRESSRPRAVIVAFYLFEAAYIDPGAPFDGLVALSQYRTMMATRPFTKTNFMTLPFLKLPRPTGPGH